MDGGGGGGFASTSSSTAAADTANDNKLRSFGDYHPATRRRLHGRPMTLAERKNKINNGTSS